MADQNDYAVGTAAAMKVAQDAIQKEVPAFFQSEIPMDKVQQYVAQVAKAVIDAVDASRASKSS